MLQRAASNAYSWWWASHIRTKQSKWLEQNLQDMEEKVDTVLKLIEGDGDSFAKRAEMYYKKRPELINFVEESYRAYRSLAERYDNISTELQNANNTIATVFPERVQFAMDEDEEHVSSPRNHKLLPQPKSNIPNVPKLPNRDLKGLLSTATNNMKAKKGPKDAVASKKEVPKSGLSKAEAIQEIDKLQRGILSLQTEKEYVKISYEHGLAQYWEIDEQIREKHERICILQDEFNVGKVIEDDEARTLMAASALRSCQESLANLQMKQEISSKESKVEQERIKNARMKWNLLQNELVLDQVEPDTPCDKDDGRAKEGEIGILIEEQGVAATQERQQLESLREKIKEYFEVGSNATLTVTEMVENIDELVNKVISLETAVLSQTALIKRLRTETDELQAQITNLEEGKSSLIHGSDDMTIKVREMEEKLHQVQDLNQSVENQNNNLQTHFTQAHCSLDKLTEKLDNVQPDEEQDMLQDQIDVIEKVVHVKTDENVEEITISLQHEEEGDKDLGSRVEDIEEKNVQTVASDGCDDLKELNQTNDKKSLTDDDALNIDVDGSNWQNLLSNGFENKEKIILKEYTTILRNYKEVKRQLGEVEKKNRESLMETTVQLNKLKNANGTKDEEIQSLRQKLSFLVTTMVDNPDMEDLTDSIEGQVVEPQTHSEESTKQGEEEEEEKVIRIDQCDTNSAIEGMFRMKIDELLGENLDFWLNFSSTFHQIQKFQTSVEDLQSEILKLEERKKKQEGSIDKDTCLKSDARPLYKHLREIETEHTLWLEQSVLLKDEMQNRIAALSNIQEEISKALKDSCQEEEMKFTSYQAAKFQGEVLNMKQENSKVSQELQAGLDHAMALQLDIQKTLAKLDDDFELSGTKNNQNHHIKHSTSRGRIPLRSFIFGVKQKKQRMSIFSSMHPALHRKHNDVRSTHTS